RDRPWQGTYRLVAIYSRALSTSEVERHFQAGRSDAPDKPSQPGAPGGNGNAELFATKIAPLISTHCLECHDTATRQGKLDLSQKTAALAGGESGPAYVAGSAAKSLLWQLVDS